MARPRNRWELVEWITRIAAALARVAVEVSKIKFPL
jgi:hypothetical protein